MKFSFTAFFAFLLTVACSAVFGQGCPSIEIKIPDGVQNAGGTFTVTAQVKGSVGIEDLRYDWTVSAGIIESGQGSNSIVVAGTKAYSGQTVALKVVVNGLSPVCSSTAERAIAIADNIVCGMPVDDFGEATAGETKARVDNLFVRLNQDPEIAALVVIYSNSAASKKLRTRQIQYILNSIKFRKYDLNRVGFLFYSKEQEFRTIFVAGSSAYVNEIKGAGGEFIDGVKMQTRLSTLIR